jgi:hypothetical protein
MARFQRGIYADYRAAVMWLLAWLVNRRWAGGWLASMCQRGVR